MNLSIFPKKSLGFFTTALFAILLFFVSTTFQSCKCPYSASAVETTQKLNKSVPELMEMAVTKKYDDASANIVLVKNDIESALNTAKSEKCRKEIAEMWRVFRDEQANPFFEQWKTKGKLDKDFVKNYAASVKKSLDAILRSEKAKKK